VSGVLVTIDGFCFWRLAADTSGHQDTTKTLHETPSLVSWQWPQGRALAAWHLPGAV